MANLAPKFVAAAKAKDWKKAYDEINGQTMEGMLDGLQEIGSSLMQDMRAQMSIYDVWGGPGMFRIQFAMDVVEFRKIPQIPDKLPPDQVVEAKNFLAHSTGSTTTHGKRIRIALFWTEAAKQENVSSKLVQKARELLRSNNTGFELDVAKFHENIAYKGEIFDSDDTAKALQLAKQAPSYAGNRLCVIFYRITPTQCDANRQQCPRIPYANTPRDGAGNPYVLVNVNMSHPDNATLLHEIGHAAGVESRDCDDNLKDLDDIMSYGTNRTKIGTNHLNKLKRQGVFFIGS